MANRSLIEKTKDLEGKNNTLQAEFVERRKAEEELNRIFELSVDMICVADIANGYFIKTNPAFGKTLGYSNEEILSIPILDFVHPDDRTKTNDRIKEQLSSGAETLNFENRYLCKNGPYKWLMWTAHPIPEKGIAYAIARDITEKKIAEEVLRDSENKYRSIFENNIYGIAATDYNFRFLSVNPAFCKLLGYNKEEICQLRMPDVSMPEDAVKSVELIEKMKRREFDQFTIEKRYRRKDGSIVFARTSVKAMYDKSGNFLQSVATIEDITERKCIEDALRFVAQKGWSFSGEASFRALLQFLSETLKMDYASIAELADGQEESVHTKANYAKGRFIKNIEYTLQHTPCQKVIENMLYCHPQKLRQAFPLDELLEDMKAESYIGIACSDSKGTPIGLIALIDCKPLTNVSLAKSVLQIVAVRVAHELERNKAENELKKSREELRALTKRIQAVREEERRNIARNIHDELGQVLTVLSFDLSRIMGLLGENQKLIIQKTKEALKHVDSAIESVQRISSELRPTILDNLGIKAAIDWQANEFQNKTGIACRVASESFNSVLESHLATSIFRIFQETLTNVARHAHATKVDVLIKEKDGHLVFSMRDDGKGITKKEISDPNALGLIGIRERVYSCQGKVKIFGFRGKGTKVLVTIPLKNKTE
ncbi:MAG: PAS domain S-box protein [Candidatus Brocadiaceae bacterium]|nr:PAS domain S-box protein [Candidatus Brocadiaceae bacterium]